MESWSFAESDEIVPGRRAVRLLGGGVRYEAYLAWDDRLRALVVVKLLRPDRTEDPGALAGLRGEAALLERLAHPLLVRGFGAGLEGQRPHVVLEFIEGPRLSTLSRRFGLSLEQVLPLALNLASVLHYRRVTLASLERGERLTADFDLAFTGGPGGAGGRLAEGAVIVESKSPRGVALADRVLRELGARPVEACSKYCLGIGMTRPGLPANPFRRLLSRWFVPTVQEAL